jgi:ubiquinone/menaquinone biosynthesis C-methylase UbiE
MHDWDTPFSRLESIDFSFKKNTKRLEKVLFFCKISKNDLVLDIFSGRCDTSYGLKSRGYRIISGDISIKLLKMNNDVKDKIQLNTLQLPFHNNQFRGIIIQGGLHHLENFEQLVSCLHEVKRVLQSNGYLFISEPANTLPVKLWLLLIKKTRLWKLSSYSRNWHDLYMVEEKTHTRYLNNTGKLVNYLKTNWTIELHRVGCITEFFTLRK